MLNSVPFFTEEMAQGYDDRNQRLSAIGESLHFIIRLLAADLPPQARILCVGVGTGAEMISLAQAYPTFNFVGVDPSAGMLKVCEKRLHELALDQRCELITGYVQDISPDVGYDAVLSILVAHFVPRDERAKYYRELTCRLKPGGLLINAEISGDLDSELAPKMIHDWKKIQALMGATPESLAQLPFTLRSVLSVYSPKEIEQMLVDAGLNNLRQFFQAFMIHAWVGIKI
ncbi:MAG: class I SAM-dependent methyltransferase [Proteobacteria bacterium]|nr:MAG: class I SAM-dependent methyltransferase [Pseudomonadota bacterium]